MTLYFLGGLISYLIAASISYHPVVKSSPYYFPIGIICSVINAVLWQTIAKKLINSSEIMIAGFWWDAMIFSVYAIVPLVFFGAKLTLTTVIGLIFIVMGVGLTKL